MTYSSQKKIMIHPREYISNAQLKLWEKDPVEYARIYFHDGEQRPINVGQKLGKTLADAMEADEETGDIEVDAILAQITPKLPRRDEIIMTKLSVGKYPNRGFVPILVKPDRCSMDYMDFQEVKTGSGPWTQKKVDEDDQMLFYFTGLYLKNRDNKHGGIVIPKGKLIWAPTEKRIDDDGVERPHLVGDVREFPTTRTFVQLLQMMSRMSTAWREIGVAMENEII